MLGRKSTAAVAIVLAVILLLVVMVSGIGSSSSAGGHHRAATQRAAALNPGQLDGSTLIGPRFGYPTRQGGCNEINAVTDPLVGPMIEIKVADTDHTLPGTNSPPLGGCYAVHRKGGVAAGLLGSPNLQPYHEYFVAMDLMVPSAQPGLPNGVFPIKVPGPLSVYESFGGLPPNTGPPIFVVLTNNQSRGGELELQSGYGSLGGTGRTASLWEPHAFTFNVIHHVVLDYVISPCGTNTDRSQNPAGSVACKAGQVPGRVAITDNGVALQDHNGSGASTSQMPTEYATVNQFPFFYTYRGTNWGGQTRILMNNLKVGTTLASVQ